MINNLISIYKKKPELINNGLLVISNKCTSSTPCIHNIYFYDSNNNLICNSNETAITIYFAITKMNIDYKYLEEELNINDYKNKIKMHFSYVTHGYNLPIPGQCVLM